MESKKPDATVVPKDKPSKQDMQAAVDAALTAAQEATAAGQAGEITIMAHPPADGRKIALVSVEDVRINGLKIKKAIDDGATVQALDLALQLASKVLREVKERHNPWLVEETLIAIRDPATDATVKA